MKKVFISAPFRDRKLNGQTFTCAQNVETAKRLCRYASLIGYIPICPIIFLHSFLSTDNEKEMDVGLKMAIELEEGCDEFWLYSAIGISSGMQEEIDRATKLGIPIREVKTIPTELVF